MPTQERSPEVWLEAAARHYARVDKGICAIINQHRADIDRILPKANRISVACVELLREVPAFEKKHEKLKMSCPKAFCAGSTESRLAMHREASFYELVQAESALRAASKPAEQTVSVAVSQHGQITQVFPRAAAALGIPAVTEEAYNDAVLALLNFWADKEGFKEAIDELAWSQETVLQTRALIELLLGLEINQQNAQGLVEKINSASQHQFELTMVLDSINQFHRNVSSRLASCSTLQNEAQGVHRALRASTLEEALGAVTIDVAALQKSYFTQFCDKQNGLSQAQLDQAFISAYHLSTGDEARDVAAMKMAVNAPMLDGKFCRTFYRYCYPHLSAEDKKHLNELLVQKIAGSEKIVNECFGMACQASPELLSQWKAMEAKYRSVPMHWRALIAFSILSGCSLIGLSVLYLPLAVVGGGLVGGAAIGEVVLVYRQPINYRLSLFDQHRVYAAKPRVDAQPLVPNEFSGLSSFSSSVSLNSIKRP